MLKIKEKVEFSRHENRMYSVANTEAARKQYYSSSSLNVKYLLEKRFSWMNDFINEEDIGIEVGSGAGFLKVPKTFGEYSNKKKKLENYRGGNLNFIHGQKHFLSNSILSVKPQVGDFYLFPNYLMHTVYPFKGTDDERRSISFNADIDEEIYNVYEN